LVWDKSLTANVEYREGEKLNLVLGDSETQQLVNVLLVREGLALVSRKSNGYNPSLVCCERASEQGREGESE
jgi:hypothetical protein